MRKVFLMSLFSAVVLLFSGCGYTIGNLGHPQLESVAVAPVSNETLFYNASAQMRGMLTECFTTDGTMKLVSAERADCIVYAKITDVNFNSVNWSDSDEDEFMANEWKCSVKVSYSVILPGRAKPLVANRKVTGSTRFTSGPDLESARINGMRQAMYSAAKNIVASVTEAW